MLYLFSLENTLKDETFKYILEFHHFLTIGVIKSNLTNIPFYNLSIMASKFNKNLLIFSWWKISFFGDTKRQKKILQM